MPYKYTKLLIWIVSLIHGPGMAWKLGNCPSVDRNRPLKNTPALALFGLRLLQQRCSHLLHHSSDHHHHNPDHHHHGRRRRRRGNY